MLLGALLGASIFLLLLVREQHTRTRVTKVEGDVRVIKETSPCTNLTTAECAVKLLRALPREQREQIHLSERTLQALENKARVERRRLDRGQPVQGANGRPLKPKPQAPGSAGGGGGGGGGANPPPSSPPSSQPSSPPGPTSPPSTEPPSTEPTTPEKPKPTVTGPSATTPTVSTPQIGPVPPVTVPPIEVPPVTVPCVPVPPAVTC